MESVQAVDIQKQIYKKNDFYWKYVERPKRIISRWFDKLLGFTDNAVIIQREADRHRYELVYQDPFDIYILLGWTDQYENDYYWVVYEDRGGIRLISCVGGFIWLKNRLTKHEYYSSASTWLYNNNSIEEMLKEAKAQGIKIK